MTSSRFKPEFNRSDVTVESVERCFDGFFKIDKYKFKHKLFAGGESEVVEREIFERGHAVAILPYDPKLQKVVLIEQIRIGASATKDSPWLLEVIAGMVDKENESMTDVAKREALEEANLTISNLTPMLSYLSSPGGTTERLYLYLAIVDSSEAGGVHGLDDEHEDIKVHVFDVEQVFAMLEDGTIDNAAAVICIQWLQLNKAKIDKKERI